MNYSDNFKKFVTYIKQYTKYQYTSELTQYDIDNYVLYLKNIGLRDTSINSYLRGLRAVLNHLIENNQCSNIKVYIHKADKCVKATYTDNELVKLLQKPCLTKCDFVTYRNWCIINFLLATGVRASTLIHIKNEDIDMSFDRIHLTYTKNRKSYLIPMSGQLKHAIAKYNKLHGVSRTSIHAFRHTFAKKCVLNGVNVFVLQRLMGHSDISVTKEYVDLYAEDLAYNIESYNPLDTLGEMRITKSKVQPESKKKKITINL